MTDDGALPYTTVYIFRVDQTPSKYFQWESFRSDNQPKRPDD